MLRTLLRDDLWQQSFKLIAKLFSTNKMRPVGFKKEGIQDIKFLVYNTGS